MSYSVIKNDYTAEIRKLCIFCTFFYTDQVPAYVLRYIRALKEIGYETMVVSHSAIGEKGLEELTQICCAVVIKDNVGYDFFAWRKGMELCEDGQHLEQLLLTNDSIIGPFGELGPIFSTMCESHDFWGLTENYEHNYHIQSYFLHANRKVLQSDSWKSFWGSLQLYSDKLDIVRNYEVELSQTLSRNEDISMGAWIKTDQLENPHYALCHQLYPDGPFWHDKANPTIKYWKELITDFNFPFIKKNLFFDKEHYHVVNDGQVYVYNVYPVNWKNVLTRTFGAGSIVLVEEYLADYFRQACPYTKTVREQYKVVLVYEQLEELGETDYLFRLLESFNQAHIAAELVLRRSASELPAPSLDRLRDLAKVVLLKDLSATEMDQHRHMLASEKVGLVIAGNTKSLALADSYAYTGAELVMVADKPLDMTSANAHSLQKRMGQLRLITPSPSLQKSYAQLGLPATVLDALPEYGLPKINRVDHGPGQRFRIGIIGINDLDAHEKHLVHLTKGIVATEGVDCLLLLAPGVYQQLQQQLRSKGALSQLLLDYPAVQAINLDEWKPAQTGPAVSMFLSYHTGYHLPDLYLYAKAHAIPVLGFADAELAADLNGSAQRFRFAYFNTGPLLQEISRLAGDAAARLQAGEALQQDVQAYCKNAGFTAAPSFFCRELVDFSELHKPVPRITVVFHFHFYSFDRVTFLYYKLRLREFYRNNVSFLFSITEDSYDIPEHAASLTHAFPGAVIKVVPNKGRDIGAKFLLFDHYFRTGAPSEYLVVLHDKKSLHLPYWEARLWIESLLKVIDSRFYQPILDQYERHPQTGVIGTGERIVDCILRWQGTGKAQKPVFEWNNDLLHQMIEQYALNIDDYHFVGGTMFWIKSSLLEKMHERHDFLSKYAELEEGNVMDNSGSTITHCWERLICWMSTDMGYKVTGI